MEESYSTNSAASTAQPAADSGAVAGIHRRRLQRILPVGLSAPCRAERFGGWPLLVK